MRSILQLTEEPDSGQAKRPGTGTLGLNQSGESSSAPSNGSGHRPDDSPDLPPSPEAPPEMFLLELPVRLPALRSLVSSVMLHTGIITLLMTVSIPLRPPEVAKDEPSDPTEIRIGNHLYYVAQISGDTNDRSPSKIDLPRAARAGKAGARAQRPRPAESIEPAPSAAPEPAPAAIATAAPAPQPAETATQAANEASRRALARTFVPPEVKRSPTATQTLIQPMSPPDLVPPPTPLPSFRVMTPQFPRLNRKFVAPGRIEERPPAQTPTVSAPEFQMVQADPVATNIQPKLPLPVAPPPPDPVKAPEGPAPSPKGEPLSILSLNDRNVPLTDSVVVPPGNIAQEAGGATTPSNSGSNDGSNGAAKPGTAPARGGSGTGTGTAASASTSGTANGAGAANGRGASTTASLGSTAPGGSGLGNAPAVLPGAGAGAAGSTGRGTGSATNGLGLARDGNGRSVVGTGTGAALTGGSTTGSTTAIVGGTGAGGGTGNGTATLPGQIIIQPATGNFDAVVVQSSPLDQYPESRGLLTGRPIYSVYLTVGAQRDWTLYYCIPNERPEQDSARVVQLGPPPAPIKAPYPMKLMRPEVTLPSWAKYVLVHGYVNAQGHFEGVKIVRSVLPDLDRAILASLADWEFRAATRDGTPVMVEFLISIPAKGL